MNREDIIRMAREAGLEGFFAPNWDYGQKIERFAALVAAAEREKSVRLWMLLDDIDTADDIAKFDDKLYRRICQNHQKKRWDILSEAEVDAAIRARGEQMVHAPRPREWQGLTDDEIAQLMFKCDVIVTGPTQFDVARAIEAKLQEKNHG